MDIGTVGVLGAGTMGNGIAHVFAQSGYKVMLRDVEQRFLDRAMDTISKNLEREVRKNKITAEQCAQALGRIGKEFHGGRCHAQRGRAQTGSGEFAFRLPRQR